jgi:endonuclease/exonuclease/phosphatase (EEP) superfamily protein YafD
MADLPPPPVGRRPLWHWLVLAASLPASAGIALAQTAAWTWAGELASHWTLHGALALLPALVVFRRDARWGRVLVVLMAFGLAPWLIAAFAPRAVAPPAVAATARVACANVYYYNRERERLVAALVALDPDILGLVEVGDEDRRLLKPDPRWPHQVWTSRRDLFKVALLSRRRIVTSQIHEFDGTTAIEALIDLGAAPLRVLLIHPYSPTNPQSAQRRDHALAQIAERSAASREPLVVVGDWNLTAGAPLWRPLLARSGLHPAPGRQPATWPWFLGPCGIAIDHILARDAGLDDLAAFSLPGSDHRGLVATVAVPPWTSAPE